MLKTPVDTGNGMTVKIATKAQQGPSAIGQSTWTGGLLLARALCAEAPRHGDIDDCSSPHTAVAVDADWSVVGRTCLELGCGTGLAGPGQASTTIMPFIIDFIIIIICIMYFIIDFICFYLSMVL